MNEPVYIDIGDAPLSVDPLEYDLAVHHFAFRSVLSSLISESKLGQVVGVIASRWETSATHDVWRFYVREGMSYRNGDPINAHEVYLSFRRAAFLMKKQNSESGFLEHLVGFESISDMKSPCPGIFEGPDYIEFRFKTAQKNLLKVIGFGLYAIASSKAYDPLSGVWLDRLGKYTSGPYSVADWTKNSIHLSLRPAFPRFLLHERPIHNVQLLFNQKVGLSKTALVIGSNELLKLDSSFTFVGPVESMINYAVIDLHSGSQFIKSTLFTAFRNCLLRKLVELQAKVDLSFLPFAIDGIKPASLPPAGDLSKLKGSKIKVGYLFPSEKSAVNQNRKNNRDHLIEALDSISKQFEFEIEYLTREQVAAGEKRDIQFRYTGILIDEPLADIRFMFLSKHGIQLPDIDGRISALLKKPSFSPQEVNELIWDQGVVWPINHSSMGMWLKEGSGVDLSLTNTTLPPLDLEWIGYSS